MKNLKINKNLSKKLVSFVLVGTIGILTLSGCSGKNSNKSLLEGTILENTSVVTFEDGTKDIARIEGVCVEGCGCTGGHEVFNSIVTNEYYNSSECYINFRNVVGTAMLKKYLITSDESIIKYLTNEEIAKASKAGLTEEDIANILNRVFTKEEEKTK